MGNNPGQKVQATQHEIQNGKAEFPRTFFISLDFCLGEYR
jgi:hypothetical protein